MSSRRPDGSSSLQEIEAVSSERTERGPVKVLCKGTSKVPRSPSEQEKIITCSSDGNDVELASPLSKIWSNSPTSEMSILSSSNSNNGATLAN